MDSVDWYVGVLGGLVALVIELNQSQRLSRAVPTKQETEILRRKENLHFQKISPKYSKV